MVQINTKQFIAEIPMNSMPREKMLQFGEKNLSNHELLAILLRTGSKKTNVLQLATTLEKHFGSLHSLRMATIDELMEIEGIGPIKAIELKAAIELGVRLASSRQIKKGSLISTKIAGTWMMEALKDEYQEQLLALFLNTKNEVILTKMIFKGGLNQSIAHPREIFREAVRCSAARLIIGHNHPSGNVTPSQADIDFTKRMVECGQLMGIELLDHIIVGNEQYLSLQEGGYM